MRDYLVKFAAVALMCLSGLAVMAQSGEFDNGENGEPIFDMARANSLPRAERLAYNRAYKAAYEAWTNSSRTKTAAPKNFKPKKVTASKLVVGTIQYDDGVVSGPATAPTSETHGNQYNTANGGPVMANGSVTQIDFYMVSVAGTAAFVSVYGPVSGTVASVLTSANVPAVAGFNNHVFATPVNYVGNSFLAGVWLNAAPPGADAVGLGGGTTGGQGFHGMNINDITGTGFNTVPSVNYLVRPTGNILTPVELINFEIE